MYRVLIVDDESYIVDWLSSFLETQAEPELNICRAYSGTDALKWLNRTKIDILLTDICMPEMNGISLLEKVRENWPHCKVILLTAHAEFDFAYNAIKNDVTSFILKSESDERILEEVKKAVRLLEEEMNNLQLLNDMQEKLQESTSVIRKEILMNILKGNHREISRFIRQLQDIGTDVSAGKPFLLLTGRVENIPDDLDIVEKHRKIGAIEKIIEHYLERHILCHPVEYGFNRLALLMQERNESGQDSKDSRHTFVFVRNMLETIQQSCMETLNVCISFALHESLLQPEHLSEKFHALDGLLNLTGTEKTGFIISDNSFINSVSGKDYRMDDNPDMHIMPDMTEELKNYLDNGKWVEFTRELEKNCIALEAYKSLHSNYALEIYYSIAVMFISYINRRRLTEKIAFRIGLNELFNPRTAGSWSSVADYLRKLAQIIRELQKEDDSRLSSNIIQFVKEYINVHLTEDVSLVKLSEVTGYNSSYLSRFFRENTGETINNYTARQKLSKVKELMSDKSLNINDIAVKTGFDSRTYFNRFIKKCTGLSPQEFRNILCMGKNRIRK